MRAIVVDNPGRDYRLLQEQVPTPRPGPGQVLIEVAAAGVNRADLLQARGGYPPPAGASALLGLECSGTVAELGSAVADWQVGDQVAALLPGGGYARYAVADSVCLFPVYGVPLGDAGAAPESACTVWSNLLEAGYRPGASVLAHGGAGGIGTMAITLGSALGSPVVATAGSPRRAQACEALGAVRGVDYRGEDFVAAVHEATDGRGADVILDVVGGPYLARNLAALAEGGTLVVIGLMGGARAEVDLAAMLRRRQRLIATNLRGRSLDAKARIVREVLRDVWPLITSGAAAPVIGARFQMHDADQAHAALKAGDVVGKILLTWD
ncbi:MAG: NAD(P)H-quinone oxidoreductase [Bifidobacteriaceae bacterium]|jgi:putative PIG3 family NAD(P)H quinone oxidoreductase|nr:NAD(P)H-quinone oxidoreductase [Bifidobacteriaceae bacterium]